MNEVWSCGDFERTSMQVENDMLLLFCMPWWIRRVLSCPSRASSPPFGLESLPKTFAYDPLSGQLPRSGLLCVILAEESTQLSRTHTKRDRRDEGVGGQGHQTCNAHQHPDRVLK